MSDWERITALFGAARELAPDERNAFLDVVCAREPGVRAEIERLLEEDEQPAGFLATPLASPSIAARLVGARPLEPGETLKDRYRVEKPLGRGGQALVYLATDTVLSRPVVIKVIRGSAEYNTLVRARFEQEKRALALIDHPGVVGIVDVGELADGAPYLVIQYIEGESLRQVLASGALELDRAVNILRQLGSAIGATHAVGVAHHDLKPENIMLQRSPNGQEAVKVIDFGIAKVERVDVGALNTTVLVAGTVRYMAPEQFEGRNLPASDIYALALVACEMLSGKPDLRALPKHASPRVRRAIELALTYEADDRPRDARLWADDLAHALLERKGSIKRSAVLATTTLVLGVALSGGRWIASHSIDPPGVVEKVGAYDPLQEGFRMHNELQGTVAENPTRDGYDGWVVSTSRQGHYYQNLTPSQKRLALANGWVLTAVMRVEEGQVSAVVDFAGIGRRYDIGLHRDGDADRVRLQTQIVPALQGLDTAVPHDGKYHRYELRYDPGLGFADLWIDGEKRLTGYRGHGQFQGDGDLSFGAAVFRSPRAKGSFQLVRFEINR